MKRIQQKMEIWSPSTSTSSISIRDYLDLIDVITLWTGNPAELVNLEANLKKLEKLAPGRRRCWAAT